jgi:hypothetical protein
MKKNAVLIVLGLVILSMMSSCFHLHHDNISISVSDDEDEYEMQADYRKKQSHAVQVYLNNHLLNNSGVSIHNGFVDDEITLDDKTTFYINTNPGELNIRINKNENSEESCERVKQICEELKQILADN